MIEPWNPWLAILPFMIFIFLVGEVVAPIGNAKHKQLALVGAIIVGSYCIQCHAGYAVLVVGALAAAVVVWVRDEYRSQDLTGHQPWSRVRQGLIFGLTALVVVWLPVVIDQLRRKPGNVSILLEHFVSPSEPAMGVTQAAKIIATQFNLFGLWLSGPGADAPAEGWARYIGCLLMVSLWFWATWKVRKADQSAMFRWQMMMALVSL
jgi:hypothetical protein